MLPIHSSLKRLVPSFPRYMTTTISHRPPSFTQQMGHPPFFPVPPSSSAQVYPTLDSLLYSMENQAALPTLTPFTSSEGKTLFRGALLQGQTESFFKLLGNFTSQPSPHLAGISSLTMALNALEIDPKTIWKGNWRWYSGDQLKPCSPTERVTEHGIPFDEFTCLAQLHCSVSSFRVNYAYPSYELFLQTLQQVTSNPSSQLVVHYSRSVLGQKGTQGQDAHYSPIGAHNADKEQTLIMDVDRVRHPSVWVPTKDLYRAMLKSDPSTGLSRGYFVLKQGTTFKHLKCQGCTNRTCQT